MQKETAGMCLSTKNKKMVTNTRPVVAVQIMNPMNGKTEKTYAMLDGGSEFSIVDQSLARKLGLETTKEEMTVTTLESTIEKERHMCHATLSSIDQTYVLENSKLMLAEALPTLTCPVPKNRDIADYTHLRGIKVIELPHGKKVSLIIGTNEPRAHVPSEVRMGSRFEPQALRTPFGWTVLSAGPSNGQCAYMQKSNDEIHHLFEKMYNHDFQDAHIEKTAPSRNDLQAEKVWKDSIKMVNGQYQLDLPWKEGHRSKVKLPDSSAMALSRAKRFGAKMKREPETFKMVKAAIKEYEEEGFSRRLT